MQGIAIGAMFQRGFEPELLAPRARLMEELSNAGSLRYTFPSCSPDPDHLTVLARPGFVEAACQPSLRSKRQTASNSTNLLRQAGGGGLETPLGSRAPRGARCRRPKSG